MLVIMTTVVVVVSFTVYYLDKVIEQRFYGYVLMLFARAKD
jgi:hypothetical protein